MNDPLLLADEVAALIRVEPMTLYTWRHREVGPRSFKVGRRVVYRESAVLAWLAEQEALTSQG